MGDGIACQITSYVGTEPIYCVGLRGLLLRAFGEGPREVDKIKLSIFASHMKCCDNLILS